jgi:hypothetical protein
MASVASSKFDLIDFRIMCSQNDIGGVRAYLAALSAGDFAEHVGDIIQAAFGYHVPIPDIDDMITKSFCPTYQDWYGEPSEEKIRAALVPEYYGSDELINAVLDEPRIDPVATSRLVYRQALDGFKVRFSILDRLVNDLRVPLPREFEYDMLMTLIRSGRRDAVEAIVLRVSGRLVDPFYMKRHMFEHCFRTFRPYRVLMRALLPELSSAEVENFQKRLSGYGEPWTKDELLKDFREDAWKRRRHLAFIYSEPRERRAGKKAKNDDGEMEAKTATE